VIVAGNGQSLPGQESMGPNCIAPFPLMPCKACSAQVSLQLTYPAGHRSARRRVRLQFTCFSGHRFVSYLDVPTCSRSRVEVLLVCAPHESLRLRHWVTPGASCIEPALDGVLPLLYCFLVRGAMSTTTRKLGNSHDESFIFIRPLDEH